MMDIFEKIRSGHGKSCLRLTTAENVSNSFIGGLPKCARAFEWPRKDGEALGFIGQLDLGEFNLDHAVNWLPKNGRLLFFYDLTNQPWGFAPKDDGSWAVIYDAQGGEVSTAAPPRDYNQEFVLPEVKHLRATPYISMPSLQQINTSDYFVSEEEAYHYHDFVIASFNGEPHHQMSGYPDAVQSDSMEEQCQLVTGGVYCGNPEGYRSNAAQELRKQTNDWLLLFQFDSDDDVDIMWGDSGMLYFWIRESDARQENFSNVWMILQCC